MAQHKGRHVHGFTASNCRVCGEICTACAQCHCDIDARYGAAVRSNLAAAQEVYEGKAFGGPRDGIKLKASARWDGKLRDNDTGHYEWRGAGWQWLPTTRTPRRDGRYR